MQTLVWAGGLLLAVATALEVLVGLGTGSKITVRNDDPIPYQLWIRMFDDLGPEPLLFLFDLPPGGFRSRVFESVPDPHSCLVLTDPDGVPADWVNLDLLGDPRSTARSMSYTIMKSHLMSS